MDLINVLNIVLAAITIAVAILGYYFAVKEKLETNAQTAIIHAEVAKKKGKEKMKLAVQELKSIIPAVARPFFTDENIEKVVQRVFDEMEKYAKSQIVKKGR